MPLGEEPITAYFPRLSSGKVRKSDDSNAKRKSGYRKDAKTNSTSYVRCASADDPGPSRKRSRKATTSSLSSVSSGTPPPAWDLFSKAPKTKRSRRNHATDNKTPSVISLDDDTSMEVEVEPSTNTNPTTVAKRKQKLHSQPATPHTDESTISLSEAPKPRRIHQTLHHNFSSTNVQLLSKPNCKFGRKNTDGDDESDVEVLSSQAVERADELFLRPFRDPTLRQSTTEAASTKDRFHQTDTLSPFGCSYTTFVPDDKEYSIIHNNDTAVDSSQTQNILLNYVSPRRPRIRKRLFVPDAASLYGDEDNENSVVQSSQTQSEIDLQAQSQAMKQLFKREPGSSGLVRTPSDALFSVPRRDASFTVDSVGDLPIQTMQDDSATESDSESEMANRISTTTLCQDISGWSTRSQSHAADQTQSLASETDDYESLPDAVKDFQAMF